MSETPKFKMIGIWQLTLSDLAQWRKDWLVNFDVYPNQAGKLSLSPGADTEFNPVMLNALTLNEVPCLGCLLKLGFTSRPHVIHI